ncbi:MAG: division/cell wall cluster transcriptional repressor MraZ [Bacteroidetes bacterium]|nr:division/cell wall cluster transcriptional repressor MraZ [Bacteroidota bacterium]
MANFIGEYVCKVDAKGRVVLPAGLKKQISPEAQEKFVVNRGFEKHLVLYPFNEWQIISAEVNKLNLYVKKNRDFVRKFMNGATEVELDNINRFLLPKRLTEYAEMKNEVILFAYANRIEIWAKEEYERTMKDDTQDFASLAEEVMGNKSSTDKELE